MNRPTPSPSEEGSIAGRARSGVPLMGGAGGGFRGSMRELSVRGILTPVLGGGQTRFKGSLNELGTVTVGGSAASLDSRNTNFTGFAATTTGTNVIPVVAMDYSSNRRTNNYQLVVTNTAGAFTLQYDLNGNLTNDGNGLKYEYDAADRTKAV